MGGRRCALPPDPPPAFFIIYPALYLSNSYSDTSLPYLRGGGGEVVASPPLLFGGGGGVVTPPPPPRRKPWGGGGDLPPPKPARDKTGRTIENEVFQTPKPTPLFQLPHLFVPKVQVHPQVLRVEASGAAGMALGERRNFGLPFSAYTSSRLNR